MTSFHLKIVTADGLVYDGPAEEVIVRAVTGDMAVLAGHINCVAPLGRGRTTIVANAQRRWAVCSGGLISVMDGNVTLVPSAFQWEDSLRS